MTKSKIATLRAAAEAGEEIEIPATIEWLDAKLELIAEAFDERLAALEVAALQVTKHGDALVDASAKAAARPRVRVAAGRRVDV